MNHDEILALFDESGKKIAGALADFNYTTEAERQKLIDEGYIVVSAEDFDLYCNNIGGKNGTGYIRDSVTGKPTDAPPYTMSKSEKANVYFHECQANLQAVNAEIIAATIDDDQEYLQELKKERENIIEKYKQSLNKLEVNKHD